MIPATQNYNLQQLAQLGITYYGFATYIEPPDACPTSDATSDGLTPTANQNFRIALSQAVNKQQFLDLTFGGVGQIANSMIMPGLLGYQGDEYAGPYPFDPVAANVAMQTALDEMGIVADPATADVTTHARRQRVLTSSVRSPSATTATPATCRASSTWPSSGAPTWASPRTSSSSSVPTSQHSSSSARLGNTRSAETAGTRTSRIRPTS